MPGFLELLCPGMSVYVYVFVCLPPRLLITSGVMWHDMDSIIMIGQISSMAFIMAVVVDIDSGHGVSFYTRCGN